MRPWGGAALIAAAALALAGCYASDRLLLDPARAVTPLATGRQQAQGSSTETVEIALDPDRWYRVTSGKETDRLLLTPLADGAAAASDQRYAFAVAQGGGGYIYGVAERQGGVVWLDLPFCDLGPARDAAIAHGVAAPANKALGPVCTFSDAAKLKGALTDYAARPGDKPDRVGLPAAP